MRKAILAITLVCGVIGGASAQTFSSFHQVDSITGVTVVPGLGTAPFTVSLNPGASAVINGTSYGISQVFGVYALSSTGDLTATAGTMPSGWTFVNNNSGPGGMAGYEGNANGARINAGESKIFSFGSLSGDITSYGFHVMFSSDTPFGQTAFVTGGAAVPEPASMAALTIGGLGLLRRKRKM